MNVRMKPLGAVGFAAFAYVAVYGVALWQYLADGDRVSLPLPQIQIFGGGAHAGRRVDVQDFMVVATRARSFSESLEMTAEVYRCAGELIHQRGPLAGVADEGGWWPNFSRNEDALDVLSRRSKSLRETDLIQASQLRRRPTAMPIHFPRFRSGLRSRPATHAGRTALGVTWRIRVEVSRLVA